MSEERLILVFCEKSQFDLKIVQFDVKVVQLYVKSVKFDVKMVHVVG